MPQPIGGDEKVFKIIGWKVDSIIETGDVLTDEDLEATLIPAQLREQWEVVLRSAPDDGKVIIRTGLALLLFSRTIRTIARFLHQIVGFCERFARY